MKAFILFILVFSFTCAAVHGQNNTREWEAPEIPVRDKRIVYSGTVATDKTQNQLFEKAKEWYVYNLSENKQQPERADKEEGIISGKGVIAVEGDMFPKGEQKIIYNIVIDVDGSTYSYSMSGLLLQVAGKQYKYEDILKEDTALKNKSGQWSPQFRYEMLSNLNSFMQMSINGMNKFISAD